MKRSIPKHDPLILGLAFLASFVGLLFIFDAGYARSIQTSGSTIPAEFRTQIMLLVVSVVGYAIASHVPLQTYRRLTMPLWIVTLVALLAVDFIGHEQNEAKRWIAIGPVSVQPSEFAKLSLILFLAALFAKRDQWRPKPARDLATWLDRNLSAKIKRIAPFVLVLLGVFLVEMGKDLGTAAVLMAIALVMCVAGGVSWKTMGFGMILISLCVGGLLLKQPYRMERITNHYVRWDPKVVDDVGFQTTQSERGQAEGYWFGQGLADGQVKQIIPAPTTDFIMATIGEETGLVGSTVVIGLLALICGRLLVLSQRTSDRFGALILIGASGWIGIQTCTNVMMANATLPAIGIPIPFISSGGSSLMAIWLTMGVCQSALVGVRQESTEPEASRANRSNRRRHWWTRLSRA